MPIGGTGVATGGIVSGRVTGVSYSGSVPIGGTGVWYSGSSPIGGTGVTGGCAAGGVLPCAGGSSASGGSVAPPNSPPKHAVSPSARAAVSRMIRAVLNFVIFLLLIRFCGLDFILVDNITKFRQRTLRCCKDKPIKVRQVDEGDKPYSQRTSKLFRGVCGF